MKLFQEKDILHAFMYAEEGGQALHLFSPEHWPTGKEKIPLCFKRSKEWGHLIDYDLSRLIETAKSLGVKVIKVGHKGRPGQHIDLCGQPLLKAKRRCRHE